MMQFCYTQNKVEIEKKVSKNDVPEQAKKDLISSIGVGAKVKWFYQEDGEKRVYEAKFKYNSEVYSVEFSLDGEIKNIEILSDFKNINDTYYDTILKYLKVNFDQFDVIKKQTEYLGEQKDLLLLLKDNKAAEDLIIQYELEVETSKNYKKVLYEFIFDRDGEFLSRREIKIKSTDIFDY